jgi:hypothetical protein
MKLSEIGDYILIYVFFAAAISGICLYIYPTEEYQKHISGMTKSSNFDSEYTYSNYIYRQISLKCSEILENVQEMVETVQQVISDIQGQVHGKFVEMSYPSVAKNTIYK